MNQLVFADPANRQARELGADALEQLGYQSEAATWRNAYLMGAQELRGGVTKLPALAAFSLDMLKAIPVDVIFDLWAIRLNPERASGKRIVINWTFTDTGEKVALNLENAALSNRRGKLAAEGQAGFSLSRATFDAVLLKRTTFADAIKGGDIKFDGDPRKLGELIAMLDDPAAEFPIVEPVQARP
jgi:alkyl sulfatase BDS1-like metallo-beta-lactamase superfamily hydrolase